MPIEDVDYLRANSTQQNYVFVVDSADRDRVAWPTPSEYSITFTAPFTNVIGFEVVEASIPRTMYNICGGDPQYPINNTICFFIHNGITASPGPSAYVTQSIDPGDYSIQTLIAQINASSTLEMHVNNDPSMPLASITVEAVSNPPDIKNVLRFRCPYPFFLDMSLSTIAESLGFDLYVDRAEATKPINDQRYTVLPYDIVKYTKDNVLLSSNVAPPNPKLYHSVDLTPTQGLGQTEVVYGGPEGIVRTLPLSSNQWVAQSFVVPISCILANVAVALSTSSGMVEGNATWQLWSNSNNAPYRNLHVRNTTGYLYTDYVDGGFTNSTSTESITPGFADINPGTYWIVLSSSNVKSTDMGVYYNDVQAGNGVGVGQLMLISSDCGKTYTNINDNTNNLEFGASLQVTVQHEYHHIVAPGIFSLVGERSAFLRCKEIEEHSYRSLSYTQHCMGIAKFKLGIVGVSENRLDFSKVPLREFHPIGKLSKISLRFVTLSGLLYDFKGVNHTITFSVHYLEPSQKQVFTRSLLNPNYTGEFIKDIHGGEYEEDEEDEYDPDNMQLQRDIYRVRENRHLPDNIKNMDMEAMQRFVLEDDQEGGDDEDEEDDSS